MPQKNIQHKPLTADLSKKAKILELAGDGARIRILCTLFDRDNVCVSDIAESLRMSVAAISHHLQLFQEQKLVSTRRQGKKICYTLHQTPLIKHIKQFICHKEKK